MKHLKGLILLGLLGLTGLGGQTASAQTVRSVRVGLNVENVSFFVDGQLYQTTQVFLWPDGSTHVIQFPYSVESDGTVSAYQYFDGNLQRYVFAGWSVGTTNGPVSYVTVSSALTSVLGTVAVEHRIDLQFDRISDSAPCDRTVQVQGIDRPGVVLVDGLCYSNSTMLWLGTGPHTVEEVAYPGYYVQSFKLGEVTTTPTGPFSVTINNTAVWQPKFGRTKRVNFSTSPGGLQLLVDHSLLTDSPIFGFQLPPTNTSSYCPSNYQMPILTPLGIPPMCIGDFNFVPGSSHTIGAPPIQTDVFGNRSVFDHFSNGIPQNGTYVTPSDVDVVDFIVAYFVKGVPVNILTDPPSLTIEIDGTAQAPQSVYGFYWGQGQTHHVKAPLQQSDSKGRMWKFISWSDGGAAEHDVTLPLDSQGMVVRATYQALGQIQITSLPAGLTISANGTSCKTPCTFNQLPGEKLHLTANQQIPISSGSRYDFDGWLGYSGTTAYDATFTSDVQYVVVAYHKSHLLQTYTDPEGGATFNLSPPSPDGYFREETSVTVTFDLKAGYKFLAWRGDVVDTNPKQVVRMLGPTTLIAHLQAVPMILPAGIQTAAGDNPEHVVAPGSLIAIYGAHMGTQTQVGPTNPLAQGLGDVYVTVGDTILPLLFVSPSQINALLPSSIAEGKQTLVVHPTGQPTISGDFTVKRDGPGIFYVPQTDGMKMAAALHQDSTLITQQSPAKRGEIITLFATGLGPYDKPVVDGFPLPLSPFYTPVDRVDIVVQQPVPPVPDGQTAPPPVQVVRSPRFIAGTATITGVTTVQLTLDSSLPSGSVLEIYFVSNKQGTDIKTDSNTVQIPVQ